ncbi:MAG: OB-fold nucleic acid binding domain-containing protein [Candidatus Ozemobacteraceae bacterium]
MRNRLFTLVLALFCVFSSTLFAAENAPATTEKGSPSLKGNTIFTAIREITSRPELHKGQFVSVKAIFSGWQGGIGAPPVTRSDWVARDEEGYSIYCTGSLPAGLTPGDPNSMGKPITVLGKVSVDVRGRPYIEITETEIPLQVIEPMVSVATILFDPLSLKDKRVRLLGVLAKGIGPRGNRFYLLADPTGAITLGRLPRLYPKGTILQITGTVGNDENGLPQLNDVEIIFAKN